MFVCVPRLMQENGRLSSHLANADAQIRVLQSEARTNAEVASKTSADLDELKERSIALVSPMPVRECASA